MNKLDKQYTDLLQDIIDNGVVKGDRTGTGTVSVFGRTIRHKMSEGFPLLTTKKMPWKTIVTELIWFLRGDTNIRYLVQNDCNIWNGDAYKKYERATHHMLGLDDLTMKEFIEKIKSDEEFAKEWGELGPIYGKQWRNWEYGEVKSIKTGETYSSGEFKYDFKKPYIDQIANLIHDLKTNPDSRRLMVNAWNVGQIDEMTLPPCHFSFQCYTTELTLDERAKLHPTPELFYNICSTFSIDDNIEKSNMPVEDRVWLHEQFDKGMIPKRAISLIWNQRSVDTFLGLPFNIASYGLLLLILAKEVNMIPGELIGNLGDTHLYSNHIEQAKEQIGRDLTDDEYSQALKDADLETFNKIVEIKKLKAEMIKTQKYELAIEYKNEEIDLIKKMPPIPFHNRMPYPLPSIEISDEVKWKEGDCLPYYSPSDFKLVNYKSHPTIKAPLSN